MDVIEELKSISYHHRNLKISDWPQASSKQWGFAVTTPTGFHNDVDSTCKHILMLQQTLQQESLMPTIAWKLNYGNWKATRCNLFVGDFAKQTLGLPTYPWGTKDWRASDIHLNLPKLKDFVPLAWDKVWAYANLGYPVFITTPKIGPAGHIAIAFPVDEVTKNDIKDVANVLAKGKIVQAGGSNGLKSVSDGFGLDEAEFKAKANCLPIPRIPQLQIMGRQLLLCISLIFSTTHLLAQRIENAYGFFFSDYSYRKLVSDELSLRIDSVAFNKKRKPKEILLYAYKNSHRVDSIKLSTEYSQLGSIQTIVASTSKIYFYLSATRQIMSMHRLTGDIKLIKQLDPERDSIFVSGATSDRFIFTNWGNNSIHMFDPNLGTLSKVFDFPVSSGNKDQKDIDAGEPIGVGQLFPFPNGKFSSKQGTTKQEHRLTAFTI